MIEATEADKTILPPKLDLQDAAELFLQELESASQTLRFDPRGGRIGCVQALQASINFLARRHVNGALAYPFLRLKQALRDLEQTPPIVDELLMSSGARRAFAQSVFVLLEGAHLGGGLARIPALPRRARKACRGQNRTERA